MKKLKCIVAIIVGGLLGLIASCGRSDKKAGPAPVTPDSATNKTNQIEAPKKGEELPVRRPVME